MSIANFSTTQNDGPLRFSTAELHAAINGRVISPDDDGYEQARTLFYGGFDYRPAVIVRPAGAEDISKVVMLARETGLELSVRSGGHSMAGHSVTNGGIMLDLSDMRGLEIDAENRKAWAEAGLTAGEYTNAAAEFGLATGFGDTPTVGIGGLTLGGGIGFLVRKHGLTIDNLLAAEVVTADGRILHVDAENHPDLFWAIRGGGGNFGVVTRFQFRLHEVGTIVGGLLILPATAEVLAGFMAAAEAAPEELSVIVNVMPGIPMPFIPEEYHGRLMVLALMAYAGEVEAGLQAVAPFRALAEPIMDMIQPMPYPGLFMEEEGDYHPIVTGYSLFLDTIDLETAGKIIQAFQEPGSPMRMVQFRGLGGAMARVPAGETAFAHRAQKILAMVAAMFDDPADQEACTTWVLNLAAAIDQGNTGAYTGFMGNEGAARVRVAYPEETWERLRAVKAQYDPTNLFRLNQNIPPDGQEG